MTTASARFAEQPVWTGDIRGPGTAGTGQQPEQYPADPGTGAGLYPQGIYIRGDLEITINGKITSKYPDVYPEAEVSKFIRLVQYKGVIDCDNTVLRQFNISRLIIQGYTLQPTDCRNVQPYSLNCVAVEPSEAVELKLAEQERWTRPSSTRTSGSSMLNSVRRSSTPPRCLN